MKHKRLLLSVIVIIALLVFGFVFIKVFYKKRVPDLKISATVLSVKQKPNIAEDGEYVITAQDSNGIQYTIDATGYMNSWSTPDEFGEACIKVPKVTTSDNIVFNLPVSEYNANIYVNCYKKNLTGYYFNVIDL
jgi:hypothetical protein